MNLSFLLDEHIPHALQGCLARQAPDLVVWAVGQPGVPPLSASDLQILEWCEENGFILITNNRRTMPSHLRAHLQRGRHVPGVLMVSPDMTVSELAEELVLVAAVSEPDEHRDTIRYLPLSS